MIGSLGEVVFTVSADKVSTFQNLIREIKAVYTTHEIINGKTLLQHTGYEPQQISFSVDFRVELGVNPLKEAEKLKILLEKAEPVKFFVGDALIGSFVVENIKETFSHIDTNGKIYRISSELTLKEYR